MIATRQDDGTYLVPSRPGRFATQEAAEQAHFDHVDRMRQALGREPSQRELLHGPSRHDPRDTHEKLLDAEWQPVVQQTVPSKAAEQYQDYLDHPETASQKARDVKNFRKATLAMLQEPAPEVTVDPERQTAIEFTAKLEWESQYDPSLDATHIEALRKMRLQAERGDLPHFRVMAEHWTANRDAADEARLTIYDDQIAALKAARAGRARLKPLINPADITNGDILAEPDMKKRIAMRDARDKALAEQQQ